MSDRRDRFLVTTGWLAAHLGEADLVVADASWHMPATGRSGRAEHEAAHIPGAVFFDIDAMSDPSSGLPHTLPSPAAFGEAVGALGIGHGSRIVVYESVFPFASPRVWWMLRAMGAGDVRVLDGGLAKWQAEDRPLESGPVRRTPATFAARLNPAMIRPLGAMRDLVASGAGQIVDARSASRFAGAEPEPRAGLRAGHMPGAVNMHYAGFAAPDGTFKDARSLAAMFDAAQIDIGQPVTTSCGSGVTAAIPLLALAVLGREESALYDGSWSEWGGLPDAPVETGPGH